MNIQNSCALLTSPNLTFISINNYCLERFNNCPQALSNNLTWSTVVGASLTSGSNCLWPCLTVTRLITELDFILASDEVLSLLLSRQLWRTKGLNHHSKVVLNGKTTTSDLQLSWEVSSSDLSLCLYQNSSHHFASEQVISSVGLGWLVTLNCNWGLIVWSGG